MAKLNPNYYDRGDRVRLSASFTSNGVAADPTAIELKVKDPSNNIATYTYALAEITKSATGNYYKDVSIDETGEWFYRWEGTGAVEAADEAKIIGEVSEF
jgi:predicted transcriptional regulator of viral defense system